jgi:hypothetical protein
MSTGKIGIGVITMGVREINKNLYERSDPNALIRIETDHERVGPARTRNKCMKYLMDQGCEHIFMFDDDCYPMMKGWEDYFINAAKRGGVHFMGLPHAFESKLNAVCDEFAYWSSIVGCFSYQDRRFMERVGYYNTKYVRYGSEDAGRNFRARHSGLVGKGQGYPAPLRAASYIMSEDVFHMNPTPNLTIEEKRHFITINNATYLEETRSGQLYYPPE